MREARFAPAREQVAAWQQALGRARDEAQRIPDPFVLRRFEGAVQRVAAELRSVEEAADVDAALLEALERARSRLGEARDVLASAAAARGPVERTLKVLSTIDKALGEARLPTADAALLVPTKEERVELALRASLGSPQRFEIERGALVPGRRRREPTETDDVDPAQAWRLFPPVDAPELSSMASPSALEPVERARRQIERLSCGAFAELGALGWLRRSNDSDAWYEGVARFEARLLAQLDAVMALGRPVTLAVPSADGWSRKRIEIDMPETLLRWSEDAVPGDTSRAFCRALVLGCLDGADTARVAVASLDAPTGLDRRAAIEALALASSPDLEVALAEACRLPRMAAAALEVSRRRKCTDVATATAALAHSDVKVARAAARALGAAPDRDLAASALNHALDRGLEPEVELYACESALRLGDAGTMRRVREHARHLPADDALLTRWLLLLSLSNDRGDAVMLRERAGDHIERLEAWGYAGRVELAEALLERIEAQPKGIIPRAHLAIFERITGIVAVDPFDARVLRAEWRGTKTDASARYRRGRVLSLGVLLEELGTYGRLQRERRMLALEVALHSGGAIRIDPDDWAARQSARVAAALGELT